MSQEYKRTEVGVIPHDWSTRALGQIGHCIIGLTYDPRNVRPDGLLVLRASNIGEGGLQFGGDVFVEIDVTQQLMVQPNDLLICVRNGSRRLIGKCTLLDDRAEGMTFGAFMSVFRSDRNHFIAYCFQSHIIKHQIHQHLGATINQITNKSLNSFQVPFPPIAEQDAIASALRDVDALLEGLNRLITKKRDLKNAVMQQLLTGRMRLPGFDGEWKLKPLGDMLTVCYGKSHRDVIATDGPYPVLASGGQIGTAERPLYDKASVLIGRKGTIDKPRYMGTPFWAIDTLFYTAVKDDNCARFFYYRFCLIQWMQYNEASGLPSLSANTIESIEVTCPEPPEQASIATVLFDMDAEICALENRHKKTQDLKQAIVQELLTGRTRLVKPEEVDD